MPIRIDCFLCSICLILLFTVQSKAETFQSPELTKTGEERERVRLKNVEQHFVTDNDKLLQKYKKKYGGGNYHLEFCKELTKLSSSKGLKPTAEMLKCREQYVIDLSTLKREKEHEIFYCMDGDKPVRTGFYTKIRNRWEIDGK